VIRCRRWSAVLGLVAAGLSSPAVRPAGALDMCPPPDRVQYRILLDGGLGKAMEAASANDVVFQALTSVLPGDIESMKACTLGATLECPPAPEAFPCSKRSPVGRTDFSDHEIHNLEDSRIVLEEFVQVRPGVNGENQPNVHVSFNYLLVPVAAGDDTVLKGAKVLLTSERVIAQDAKLSTAIRALGQGPELRALAFLCSGARRLSIPSYDEAYQHLRSAREALFEIRNSSRRDAMRGADALLRALIQAAYDRARTDTTHPSQLSQLGEGDLKTGALKELP
jgi:hypothetical protein